MSNNKKTKIEIDFSIIENLTERDRDEIKKIFSQFLSFQTLTAEDVERLIRTLLKKYDNKAIDAIFKILYMGNLYDAIQKEIKKKYINSYKFLEELRLFYSNKLKETFIKDKWPQGIASIRCETFLEPEDKESVHHITIIRNDGNTIEFIHSFDSTLWLLKCLLNIINLSIKEQSDAKYKIDIIKTDIIDIKESMDNLQKSLENISKKK